MSEQRCRCPGCQGPGKCSCCDQVWPQHEDEGEPEVEQIPVMPEILELEAQLAAATARVEALAAAVQRVIDEERLQHELRGDADNCAACSLERALKAAPPPSTASPGVEREKALENLLSVLERCRKRLHAQRWFRADGTLYPGFSGELPAIMEAYIALNSDAREDV